MIPKSTYAYRLKSVQRSIEIGNWVIYSGLDKDDPLIIVRAQRHNKKGILSKEYYISWWIKPWETQVMFLAYSIDKSNCNVSFESVYVDSISKALEALKLRMPGEVYEELETQTRIMILKYYENTAQLMKDYLQ